MHQSRNNVARASGVSVNDRQANASRLRAKLAYDQAKFLLTNGNDQVCIRPRMRCEVETQA